MTRPVFLVGPPAVGKSSTGAALAARIGRSFVDVDAEIERAAGRSIASIFEREGEASFRERERDIILRLVDEHDRVVACGAGALVDAMLRRNVLRRAHVIALKVALPELVRRASPFCGRPLLEGDAAARLAALVAARADAYAEAHAVVDASGSFDDVVARLAREVTALESEHRLVVPLGQRTYGVRIASISGREVACLEPSGVVVVTDERVLAAIGERSHDWLEVLRPRAIVALPGHGNADKTMASLERIWDAALGADIDRDAVLVAIGGGAVMDLTGFAAATLMRGIRYASIPTTLLAMVDASIGGKTAIDHTRGKNLIGAFHQPSLVLVDPSLMRTQPAREVRAGVAEIVKIGLACDAALADALEAGLSTEDAIAPAIQAKIDVVAADEREHGPRAHLNFGHTIGHAIEAAAGFSIPHGECVAVGMRAALSIGTRVGVTPNDVARRAHALLDARGLPSRVEQPIDVDAAMRALTRDKKKKGGALRFVLLESWGRARMQEISMEIAEAAMRERV